MVEDEPKYATARSLVEASGVDTNRIEDIFQVACARAFYIRGQLAQGNAIASYEGRDSGVIEVVTNSILLDLDRNS